MTSVASLPPGRHRLRVGFFGVCLTEHILLGLLREEEGLAARILLDFDADAGPKIRTEMIRRELVPAGTQTVRFSCAPLGIGVGLMVRGRR